MLTTVEEEEEDVEEELACWPLTSLSKMDDVPEVSVGVELPPEALPPSPMGLSAEGVLASSE